MKILASSTQGHLGTALMLLSFILNGGCRAAQGTEGDSMLGGLSQVSAHFDEVIGLKPTVVYHPEAQSPYHYNHAVMVLPFKGELYVLWGAAPKDEDRGVVVLYSKSQDGKQWSVGNRPFAQLQVRPAPTTSPQPQHPGRPRAERFDLQSAGLWSDGQILVAYVGYITGWYGPGIRETLYVQTSDGIHWSEPAFVTDSTGAPLEATLEETPKRVASGRLVGSFHLSDAAGTKLISSPYYTDDPTGRTGWHKGRFTPADFTSGGGQGKELEGSMFIAKDGSLSMVYRNMQEQTLLISSSHDAGQNWSAATPLIAGSPNKQCAGNLLDGQPFFLSNPAGAGGRFPMLIHLSNDGMTFDRTVQLLGAGEVTPIRFEGLYKGVGFSYPSSVIYGNDLWISYARNKEDVELLRVPLSQLM